MTAGLHVAEGVDLPLELITSSNGILAKKGAGKTSAAVVLLEEMHQVGVPVIVVDPKGDWYGIRTSASGDRPGLPIPVLGGRHGDVPLDATAGELGAAADIATTGGAFSTYLSDLTRNGLAHKTGSGLVATDILMNGAQLDHSPRT